ncbi:MBL fold metallo-hydrolase [Paenibacillus sp. FSL R10-2734]|uniref:MBL fold metallo-hydrolase n=1 Tax=Paenibacillus sp. FSL R10-2734 TaxID=2954691 RepID=UPI0030DB500D
MSTLTIWGGAGEHGRSSYLLQNKDGQSGILLDCGVKKEGPGEYPLLDTDIIPHLQAVFLSHAHEDHSIALPLLYKYGYSGKVWTTKATVKQLPDYFDAWDKYVVAQSASLPYGEIDKQSIQFMYLEEHIPPQTWLRIAPNLRIQWGRSGHLAGSVWLILELEGKSVFFSGDYTRESQLLIADSPTIMEAGAKEVVDLSIVDAAYGADPDEQLIKLQQLESTICNTLQKGGSVLLPVPTHGRSQELIVWASECFPDNPLIVEEELMAPLRALSGKTDWLKEYALLRVDALFNRKNLCIVSNSDERAKALLILKGAIIFTNDGMMQSTKAQAYFHQLSASPDNHVIFTGHLAAGSFGHHLVKQSKIEESSDIHCSISLIRYKVHQGLPDIRKMLQTVPSHRTVLVHAPKPHIDHVTSILEGEGFTGLYSLLPGSTLSF